MFLFSFSIPLLYEMNLDIICFKGAFNAMSMKYKYLHSTGQTDQDRNAVCEKRLSEAWHLYTLIEQMQRYLISGPVSRGDTVELSLKHYLPLLNLEFSKKWSRHECSKPGCGTCIIFDGGMKGMVVTSY